MPRRCNQFQVPATFFFRAAFRFSFLSWALVFAAVGVDKEEEEEEEDEEEEEEGFNFAEFGMPGMPISLDSLAIFFPTDS